MPIRIQCLLLCCVPLFCFARSHHRASQQSSARKQRTATRKRDHGLAPARRVGHPRLLDRDTRDSAEKTTPLQYMRIEFLALVVWRAPPTFDTCALPCDGASQAREQPDEDPTCSSSLRRPRSRHVCASVRERAASEGLPQPQSIICPAAQLVVDVGPEQLAFDELFLDVVGLDLQHILVGHTVV